MKLKQVKIISITLSLFIGIFSGDIGAQGKIKAISESELKDWFNTRKETYKLEQKFRTNGDKYDSVVDAYFNARDKYLVESGWKVQNFKDIEEAIYNTVSGIREQEEINEEMRELESEIDAIRNNEYMTEEQKDQSVKAIYMVFDQRQKAVNMTKHNWDVVKPYRKQLEHLDDWMAKNAEEPADL